MHVSVHKQVYIYSWMTGAFWINEVDSYDALVCRALEWQLLYLMSSFRLSTFSHELGTSNLTKECMPITMANAHIQYNMWLIWVSLLWYMCVCKLYIISMFKSPLKTGLCILIEQSVIWAKGNNIILKYSSHVLLLL